jgi:hypothetical protein
MDQQFFVKFSIAKFNENPWNGFRVAPCIQTDGWTNFKGRSTELWTPITALVSGCIVCAHPDLPVVGKVWLGRTKVLVSGKIKACSLKDVLMSCGFTQASLKGTHCLSFAAAPEAHLL